jgi:hypothetical protein
MGVSEMTIPSVGRVVHYVARGSADGVFPVACRAALVTEVPDPENPGSPVVSLAVFHPDGLLFAQDISQGEQNDHHVGGTWHWPERV